MILALSAALAVAAQDAPLDPAYSACVAEVEANPIKGQAHAERWIGHGGGAPAQHCLAMAELARGLHAAAARRLFDLAELETGDPGVGARLYQQSAEAFFAAEQLDQASASIETALRLAPESADLYAVAAKVYAAQSRWAALISAVDAADAEGEAHAGLLVLRGRARQMLGAHERAFDDVVEALRRDPTNIDALVLRGELLQKNAAPLR